MQYYNLKPAVDTKETGRAYPAVESYEDYDFNSPNSVHNLRFDKFPDFVPDIRFKLAKGARLCDMMSQATINANGFLISEKLKGIFDNSSIIPHRYYSATIEDDGIKHNYYWIHFIWEEGRTLIDFNNSKFYKQKFSNNLGYLDIKSEDDYKNIKIEFGGRFMIGFETLKLKEQLSVDLIIVPYKTYILISNKLKDILDSAGLAGLAITFFEDIKITTPN